MGSTQLRHTSQMNPLYEPTCNHKDETSKILDFKLGDGSDDFTQEQVVENEKNAWTSPERADLWPQYRAARPYNMEGYVSIAPKVGDTAPNGPALTMGMEPTTLMESITQLADSNKY